MGKGFESVMKDIDNLVALLAEEQKDDDDKKVFCLNEIDKVEDEKKVTERDIKDVTTAIAESDDKMAQIVSDIAAPQESLKQLDADVEEQTKLRKQEHAIVVETLASDNAAKELLEVTKNRL